MKGLDASVEAHRLIEISGIRTSVYFYPLINVRRFPSFTPPEFENPGMHAFMSFWVLSSAVHSTVTLDVRINTTLKAAIESRRSRNAH